MWNNAHDTYLEERVLSADPIGLVRLLYQAATGAIRDARSYLAEGDIAGRSRSIDKACAIVGELVSSLDRERGGEIAKGLAPLYDYILARLWEGNSQQLDEPLAEALGLMTTLSEAWDGLQVQAEPATPEPAADTWAQPQEPEPATNPWAQPLDPEPATSPWAQPLDPEPATNAWGQPLVQEPAAAYSSHAWSF